MIQRLPYATYTSHRVRGGTLKVNLGEAAHLHVFPAEDDDKEQGNSPPPPTPILIVLRAGIALGEVGDLSNLFLGAVSLLPPSRLLFILFIALCRPEREGPRLPLVLVADGTLVHGGASASFDSAKATYNSPLHDYGLECQP